MKTTSSSPTTRTRRRLAVAGVIVAAAIGGIVTVPLFAGAQQARQPSSSSKSTLQERKVGKYGEVLTNSAGYSLYVLSTESKGKLHCTSSSCLGGWPPLLVAKNAMITAGSGVKGKISHVTRGSQVAGHLQRMAGLQLQGRLRSGEVKWRERLRIRWYVASRARSGYDQLRDPGEDSVHDHHEPRQRHHHYNPRVLAQPLKSCSVCR